MDLMIHVLLAKVLIHKAKFTKTPPSFTSYCNEIQLYTKPLKLKISMYYQKMISTTQCLNLGFFFFFTF